MKIVSMHTKAYNVEFTTTNELFTAKIREYNGPELHLEDNSVLILPDMEAYYNLTNSPAYTYSKDKGSELNVDLYESIFDVLEDDVAGVLYENQTVTEAKRLANIPDNKLYAYRLFKEE